MKKCSDCGGELENGFMLDTTYGAVLAQRYGKGELPESKGRFLGIMEVQPSELRRVKAMRCIKCNKIHLYSQDFIVYVPGSSSQGWVVFIIVLLVITGLFALIAMVLLRT